MSVLALRAGRMDVTFNAAGYALLKEFEGCRLTAYRDQAAFLTIGYGHTGPDVYPGLTWSQQEADDALELDVSRTVDDLLDLIGPDLSDNQFSALVCLAYNIGVPAFAGSSVLAYVNVDPDIKAIPDHIKLWNKVRINGVLHVSRGLVRRRAAECALWAQG